MSDAYVVFAGQSNMNPPGNPSLPAYSLTSRVQIWTDTNGDGHGDAWNYLQPGVNTGTPGIPGGYGPEIQFAKDWLAANPTGILWIEKIDSVKGETALAGNSGLDWAPSSAGEMFDRATTGIDAARVALNGSPYAFTHWNAVFWDQGQTDAYNAGWAFDYQTNFPAFVTQAKAAWDVDQFFFAQTHAIPGTDWAWVRYGQAVTNVINPGHMVDSLGYDRQSDGVHLSATGLAQEGHGFYSLFDAWF